MAENSSSHEQGLMRQKSDWGLIVLFCLSFGLVGIDRFMITTLFPEIANELNLDYTDIGLITGALAFSWGLAALIMGNAADRIGRGKVIVGSLLVFSLLIGASGLAAGLLSLILVRVVMGFADGAFGPASVAENIDAAAPRQRGLALGLQSMMLPAVGLGLSPILVTQMLHIVDWRYIFVIFAVPGFILTYLVWKKLGPEKMSNAVVGAQTSSSLADWKEVLGYRNVKLSMAHMMCWLTCLMTASALLPNYLIDHIGLSTGEMGGVLSAVGFGSALGSVLLLTLSDKIGRKPILFIAAIGALLGLYMLNLTGNDPKMLFFWLFVVHFFNNAGISISVGPLCAESVPPKLMATALGLVVAVGELFGGGIAPIAAGIFSTEFGIETLLLLPMVTLAIAVVISFFVIETRPR